MKTTHLSLAQEWRRLLDRRRELNEVLSLAIARRDAGEIEHLMREDLLLSDRLDQVARMRREA